MERRVKEPTKEVKVDKIPEPEVKPKEEPIVEANVDPDAKVWWKKMGKGSLRFNHKIIKPGEKFRARPSEIPPQFRDLIVPLEELASDNTVIPEAKAVKAEYEIRPRGKSKTLFDVCYPVGKDEDGETIWKTINDKPLPKVIAERMLSGLV
jgi:hypothetical protein